MTRSGKSNIVTIISVSFGVLAIMTTVVITILIIRVRAERGYRTYLKAMTFELFREGEAKRINPDISISEQVEMLPYEKKYEIERENVILGKLIGKGFFGRVYEGQIKWKTKNQNKTGRYLDLYTEKNETVAIKTTKDRSSLEQMLSLVDELKILIHIGKHINIVNLLGACSSNMEKGELLVIVEYCRYGNLRDYIITHSKCFVDRFSLDIES